MASARAQLTFLLADGSSLRTDRLELAVLRARAQRITRAPRLWIDQGGWRHGIEGIAIDGDRFLVRDDAVIAVLMATRWDLEDTTQPPTLAGLVATVLRRLPLRGMSAGEDPEVVAPASNHDIFRYAILIPTAA